MIDQPTASIFLAVFHKSKSLEGVLANWSRWSISVIISIDILVITTLCTDKKAGHTSSRNSSSILPTSSALLTSGTNGGGISKFRSLAQSISANHGCCLMFEENTPDKIVLRMKYEPDLLLFLQTSLWIALQELSDNIGHFRREERREYDVGCHDLVIPVNKSTKLFQREITKYIFSSSSV